jgi:hypothetical protein
MQHAEQHDEHFRLQHHDDQRWGDFRWIHVKVLQSGPGALGHAVGGLWDELERALS